MAIRHSVSLGAQGPGRWADMFAIAWCLSINRAVGCVELSGQTTGGTTGTTCDHLGSHPPRRPLFMMKYQVQLCATAV
jgi:hypothetical protein